MTAYIARKLIASSSEAQALGRVLLPLLNNPRADTIAPLLKQAGLASIDPQQWYSQQRLLDILLAVAEADGKLGEDLVSVGMSLIDAVPLPADVNTLEDAIGELPMLYHSLHRDVPLEEGFRWQHSDPHTLRLYVNTPYPDSFVYGYLYALARRFGARGSTFAVRPRVINEEGQVSVFEFERQLV